MIRGTHRLFSVKCIFTGISVRRSKYCKPKIFYYLRTAKNFQITVPFMYNFRSLSNKFPDDFPYDFSFSFYFPLSKAIFRRKKEI